MPKQGTSLLCDTTVRTTKIKEKTYILRDGAGLWLVVEPSGRKWWKLRVVFAKKENSFSLGEYPAVTLSAARAEMIKVKGQVAAGIDPGVFRKVEKTQRSGEGSFEAVANEWCALKRSGWSPSHSEKMAAVLKKDVFPYIGSRSIKEITPPEVLAMLKRVDVRSPVTARKAYSACRQIFFHAVASGKATMNPAEGLVTLLSPRRVKHMAAPTEHNEVSRLLKAISGYTGTFPVRCALMLSPIFFVRPGTLRGMEWQDVDLDRAEWRIPIEQMKRRQIDKDARRGEVALIVPLPRQAVTILRDLHQLTGDGRFAFPGPRNNAKCISDNTVRSALHGMGFTKEDITPHGFRHMASTLLHEMGFPSHLIEKQLAHSDRNKIRAIYNHAEYMPERRKMMQAWADYLDALATGAQIIPFRSAER